MSMSEESKKLYETMNKAQNEDSPQEECRKFRVSRAVNAPFDDEPISDSEYMQLYGASAAAQLYNEICDD